VYNAYPLLIQIKGPSEGNRNHGFRERRSKWPRWRRVKRLPLIGCPDRASPANRQRSRETSAGALTRHFAGCLTSVDSAEKAKRLPSQMPWRKVLRPWLDQVRRERRHLSNC